jgi:hypothetical protein
MGDGGDASGSVEAYAALLATLADPAVDRAEALFAHGLDEDSWEAIDAEWQRRLSAAADAATEDEPAPPLLLAFAEAFASAQRAGARTVLSFERYLEVTRVIGRGGAVGEEMKRLQVTLAEYLRAHEHWMREMAADPALSERFTRAIG